MNTTEPIRAEQNITGTNATTTTTPPPTTSGGGTESSACTPTTQTGEGAGGAG
jgi:hypothetical protein